MFFFFNKKKSFYSFTAAALNDDEVVCYLMWIERENEKNIWWKIMWRKI
jgi:hypothetical protein